jgi:CDP-diacylglycerol--serine O-phosphatidyltransferase
MVRVRRRRRGIFLLPTVFTVGNLFCGYASMVQTSIGGHELAAALIVIAAILDGLDGRIARLTGGSSEFGVEFDSLADLVSFGLAPALLAWHWALRSTERLGWLVAFLWLVCAAMRLARFNTQARGAQDRRWFIGLPSPAAGSLIGSFVLVFPSPRVSGAATVAAGLAVFAVAVLMISRLRYRSFREIDLRDRRSHFWVLPVAAMLVAVALHPAVVLFVLCSAYVLSAPTVYLWGLSTRRRPASASQEPRSTEVVDEPLSR